MFTRRVPIGARRLFYQQSTLPAKRFEARSPTLPFLQPCRNFHPSRPNRISFTSVGDALIEPGHQLLNLCHTIGLPWMVAIPASALVIRAGLIFLTDIPNTKQALFLQSTFTPLRRARAYAKQRQLRSEALRPNFSKLPDDSDTTVRIHNELVADGTTLAARWNVPGFWRGALRSFAQFPAFWIMVEAIRRMAGAPRGLLGWLVDTLTPMGRTVIHQLQQLMQDGYLEEARLRMFSERAAEWRNLGLLSKKDAKAETDAEWGHYQEVLKSAEEVDALAPSVQGAVSQEPELMGSGAGESAVQVSVVQASAGPVPTAELGQAVIEHHAWYDPSFAEGGMLWFTDLAALDSSMLLPTMVCGMMWLTIGSGQAGLIGGQLLMKRVVQFIPVGLWFILINLPAGVLYYWFCSQVTKFGAQKLVERIYKKDNVMAIDRTPCKAPLIRPFVEGQDRFDK